MTSSEFESMILENTRTWALVFTSTALGIYPTHISYLIAIFLEICISFDKIITIVQKLLFVNGFVLFANSLMCFILGNEMDGWREAELEIDF